MTPAPSDTSTTRERVERLTTDGQRLRFDQLSLQRWRDGKIVHERFVYDPSSLSAA